MYAQIRNPHKNSESLTRIFVDLIFPRVNDTLAIRIIFEQKREREREKETESVRILGISKNMHMPSREKYIFLMLFKAFHNTSRIR